MSKGLVKVLGIFVLSIALIGCPMSEPTPTENPNTNETVIVPDLVRKSQAEAERALSDAGLSLGRTSVAFNDTIPEGHVVSHIPVAGTSVVNNSPVTLVLSSGVRPKTVPYVIGRTQAEAQSAIQAVGLSVGTVTERLSNSVPAGNVISQLPAAGSNLAENNTVSLVVSIGPPITVPNVVGQSLSEAIEALRVAKLKTGNVSVVYSETIPAARVMSQTPAAPASVALNSEIDLVASKGPEPIAVPDVVGLTRSNAEAAIARAGFPLGTITLEFSDTVPDQQVLEQTPSAGERVQPNEAIALVISKGPEPAVVPDVVGLPQSSAESAIVDARLAVGTITEQFSATKPFGEVISQNPAGGLTFPPNTTVSLVVSKGIEMVTTPDVAGLSESAARAAIIRARLTTGNVTEQFSDTVAIGQVLSQNPAAETPVAVNSSVSFAISKGPQTSEQTEALTATGGTSELDLAKLEIPAGALEGTVSLTMSRNRPDSQVDLESGETGASEIYTIETDGELPISSATGLFTYSLEFDETEIGDGTGDDITDVTLFFKVTTEEGTFRLAGTIVGNELRVELDSLPVDAAIQIAYNPNMRHVFSDAPGGKTLTQNSPWRTTRFRCIYDWTNPQIQQAIALFANVSQGSLTEELVSEVLKVGVVNTARDAALYLQQLKLREPNLRVGGTGMSPYFDLHLGDYTAAGQVVSNGTTWRQLNFGTLVATVLSADALSTVRHLLSHELFRACFAGYYLDIGPRNHFSLAYEESLATLVGTTFGDEIITVLPDFSHSLSDTIGEGGLSCSETSCTFEDEVYGNMDWFAYLGKRFGSDTLGFLGGNGSNGLLEQIRVANALQAPADLEAAELQLRNAMHASLMAQFNQPLSEVYWDYARNRAYEHNDESRLRPTDNAITRFTLQSARFAARDVATYTMRSDDQRLTLESGTVTTLQDIAPLTSRALVFKANSFLADITFTFNSSAWVPDAYGNALMVKAYKEGFNGVELPIGEDFIRFTGFGEETELSDSSDIILILSNVSVDKTYSVDMEAVTTVATGGIGSLSGRVTNAQSEAPLANADVVVRGRNFDDGDDIIAMTTTNNNGQFDFMDLPSGYVEFTISRDGFETVIQTATVVSDITVQMTGTVMVPASDQTGSASGTVIDTVTGDGVGSVSITLRSGILRRRDTNYPVITTATTLGNGTYAINDLSAGTYTAFLSRTGYIDDVFLLYIVGGVTTPNQNGDMSTAVTGDEVRIVLTWGEEPEDLDSHLTGPSGGGRFHVYFANPAAGNSDLDLDDVFSFGPETTTIRSRVAGTYRFSVHDYTNSFANSGSAMSNSGANVKVFTETTSYEFNITPNTPGTLWTVFELDGATGAITEINEYSFTSSASAVTKELGWRYGLGSEVPTIAQDLPPKE